MWHFSRRGFFGLFLFTFLGFLHLFVAILFDEKWLDGNFGFDNPLWIIAGWFIIGVVFFLWAGWFFPEYERKKIEEHRSAFAKSSE